MVVFTDENKGFLYCSGKKILPHFITIVVLVAVLLVYGYSIFHNQLPLAGNPDIGARFLIAMEYARDPSKALSLKPWATGYVSWLGVWPPVPFIIQGFVLRLVLFPGMSDASTAIVAVQLTSVFLVLLGFYFIGRSVALQTDEFTGLLAFLMCFCATTLLYLAHTNLSEVYAFFFVSLAIWNLFRFINQNKGLGWSVLFFTLAFFCRSESLVLILVAGVFLLAHRHWRPAALLIGTLTVLAVSKMLGSYLLVEGPKFFEIGKLYYHEGWKSQLLNPLKLINQLFWRYNRILILLSCICTLPLVYYSGKPVKHRNFPKAGKFRNDRNNTQGSLFANIRKAGSIPRIAKAYRQVGLYLVRVPIAFWAASFLIAIGVLLAEVFRGNIVPQWRYLFMPNVFMTTVIAILAAQTVRTLYAREERFAKRAALSIITVLMAFSLWSGFSHATGQNIGWEMSRATDQKVRQKVRWELSPSEKDVIQFIREHRLQGDRVAFDLHWKYQSILAAYLLDPSLVTPHQFFVVEEDPEIVSLLPEQLQVSSERSSERRTAVTHAFIHSKHPRFLVLASDQFYNFMGERKATEKMSSQTTNLILGNLSPLEGKEASFVFKSPYVLPEVEIPFTKVYENDSFIILEQTNKRINQRNI